MPIDSLFFLTYYPVSRPSKGHWSNLDLYVYDSNGTPVTSSILTSGNMEIIQFTPVMNETYTVRVVLTETSTQKTYFGLAWW